MKSFFVRCRNNYLLSLYGKINFITGRYKPLKNIEAGRIKRLVFVCRGNVCRSPYAEISSVSLGLKAISCGTDVRISAPAESTAILAARVRGKDLSGHLSRSIFNVSLLSSDCLVALDPSHLKVAQQVAIQIGCQVTLLGLWKADPTPNISDPYGKTMEVFFDCYDIIDEAIKGLSFWVKQSKGEKLDFFKN